MASDWIEMEVMNWSKYNPRNDRKKHSWFRLQNDIATEPKFHGLSAAQKFVAICLFAEASKGDGRAKVSLLWLSDQLKVKPTLIHETIQALVTSGVVRLPSGNQRLPGDTDWHTTDGRTDVTDERQVSTEPEPGGSVVGAVSPLTQDPKVLEILAEKQVSLATQKAWRDAYPDIPWVEQQILKAVAWMAENPTRKKKRFARFMGSWLSRGWDSRKAPPGGSKINLTPVKIEGVG